MCAWLLATLIACGDDSSPAQTDTDTSTDVAVDGSSDAELDAGAPDADAPDLPPCGSAGAALADDLVTLEWHADTQTFSVDDTEWGVEGVLAAESSLWEAVRFELERPAEVHGFDVRWVLLPESEDAELAAGLYPDFGYNGFDFWRWDALWEGTRCAADATGEYTTYTFETPVEITDPGLVYVAHHRDGRGEPAWALDSTLHNEGDCGSFGTCHSALNLPDAQSDQFYNGTSFPLPYDYVVRLHVRYTEDSPDETLFTVSDAELALGNRMAWGDFDNDGWDDLFAGGRLFANREGTFVDHTVDSGIEAMGISRSGGTWGDFDNDGCLDLAVFAETLQAGDSLLRGDCDGTFTDVTASAGIVDLQDYND